VEFGWTNVAGWTHYSHDAELRPDAGRFECGTMNTAGCFGLRESLALFLEVGVENMTAHIHGLAALLIELAGDKGYLPMTARTDDCGSGIVSLRKDGVDAAQVVRMLGEAGVSVSPRAGHVRVAPHFYNTAEEIERVVGLLP
jgi:selenocysteine lyase/cysteine desulfurase